MKSQKPQQPPAQKVNSVNKIRLQAKINDHDVQLECQSFDRALDVLREQAGCLSIKEGCGEGECGACSILLDGQLINSCLVPAAQLEGSSIKTLEGFTSPEADIAQLSSVQAAFLRYGGAQCGICTPGMILAATQLLKQNPDPSVDEVREALAGNLCRCTGFTKIFDSVLEAAKLLERRKL